MTRPLSGRAERRFVGTGWHDAVMRYSGNGPNFGEFAAPEVFAEVARRAEEAGWDALLVWDHVVAEKDLRWEIADPWILLTTAALAARRIRLGTAITPVARRRPSCFPGAAWAAGCAAAHAGDARGAG